MEGELEKERLKRIKKKSRIREKIEGTRGRAKRGRSLGEGEVCDGIVSPVKDDHMEVDRKEGSQDDGGEEGKISGGDTEEETDVLEAEEEIDVLEVDEERETQPLKVKRSILIQRYTDSSRTFHVTSIFSLTLLLSVITPPLLLCLLTNPFLHSLFSSLLSSLLFSSPSLCPLFSLFSSLLFSLDCDLLSVDVYAGPRGDSSQAPPRGECEGCSQQGSGSCEGKGESGGRETGRGRG